MQQGIFMEDKENPMLWRPECRKGNYMKPRRHMGELPLYIWEQEPKMRGWGMQCQGMVPSRVRGAARAPGPRATWEAHFGGMA